MRTQRHARLKLHLEADGAYDVFAENHATNALTAARIFRPDLIVLDLMMPDMGGGDVMAGLWADPLLRDTPVIFLTAMGSKPESDGPKMVSRARSFLVKPVDIGELRKTVAEHIRR